MFTTVSSPDAQGLVLHAKFDDTDTAVIVCVGPDTIRPQGTGLLHGSAFTVARQVVMSACFAWVPSESPREQEVGFAALVQGF